MRSKEKGMFVAVLLILGVAVQGCAYVVVGAASALGVACAMGEHKRVYADNFDEVYDVALVAIKDDFKLPIYEEKKEALTGTIKAALTTGTEVTVTVKFLSTGATEVRIRVGVFGDKDFSDMFFYKIEDRLRAVAPASLGPL